MQHLVDLGDDTFEVDFNAIFRVGLNDSEPAVRAAAIHGLWEDADAALIAPLLTLLQTDDSEAVRAAAASVLGHCVYEGELEELDEAKVRPIVTALKAIYRDVSQSIEVRRRALESLGFLSDDDTSQLIAQAYHHANDRLKQSAVFAMGRSLDGNAGFDRGEELAAPDPKCATAARRRRIEYAPAVRKLGEHWTTSTKKYSGHGLVAGPDRRRAGQQLLMAVLDSDAEHLHEEAEDALAELEFKADNLDFAMFDFEDEDEEEWVLDENPDDEDDDA
jgi:HEAT repeat protein